jgi:hypothetical protein
MNESYSCNNTLYLLNQIAKWQGDGDTHMASDELRESLENIRRREKKVKITTESRYYESGYIVDIHDDHITLKKNKKSEDFDTIILIQSIFSITTKFTFG